MIDRATASTQAVKMPEKWKMPDVTIGQTVGWYNGNDGSKPLAAMVTAVGQSSISVFVFHPGTVNGSPRDGVKHVADPDKRTFDKEKLGFWDHLPHTKELVKLQSFINDNLKVKQK